MKTSNRFVKTERGLIDTKMSDRVRKAQENFAKEQRKAAERRAGE